MIVLEIDKSSKVDFYGTGLPFDLAISLQIEESRKLTYNVKRST